MIRFGLASHFVEKAAINGVFQFSVDFVGNVVLEPVEELDQLLARKLPDRRLNFMGFHTTAL